jgi:integrase
MRSRGSKLPKYVYVQHIKGKTYYRFRRGGNTVRLPGVPNSAEFHSAYAQLLVEPEVRPDRYTVGSVAHTIDAYMRSADFSQLKPGTQRDYRRYLARLDNSVGHKPMTAIDNDYLHKIRDKLWGTPVAANHTMAVIGSLFRFAISRRVVKADPTRGIGKLKGGDGYIRWTESDLEAFRVSAGPVMRLALELGAYTGQRLSDVIKMKWSDYDGARIKVVQQKTGTKLSVAAHVDLMALLDSTERRGETILTSKSGRPFHSRVFSRDFRNARIAAGLPHGLSFHGLRHTAASMLAEAGATGPEIQAVTGHKSLKLVEHYIRQASQEMQADRAISRLPERAKVLSSSAKPSAKP